MEEDNKLVFKWSCISCLGLIILCFAFWGAFIYGIVYVLDALKG